MNMFPRQSPRRSALFTRWLNGCMVVLLLMGFMPVSAQAAALQRQTALCQAPGTAASTLFLPVVAGGVQQVARSVLGALAPQAPTARTLNYEVGKTYEYAYEVVVNTRSSKRDSQGVRDDGEQKTVIYALADVKITGQEETDIFVGEVSLRDPFICNTDGEEEFTADDQETLDALATPLQFKQAANGVIVAVSSPVGAPAQAINIQKGVINALQLTLQEANSYTAPEDAGQGSVNVQYVVEEKEDGLHITKTFNRASFTSLITAGPDNDDLQLQNTINIVIGADAGVITSLEYSEKIASSDGAEDLDDTGAGFDGVTAWSTAETNGSLTLKRVVATTGVTSAALNVIYQEDALAGALVDEAPNYNGIDLTTIDLDAEFAKLEAAPDNPDHRAYILALVDADDANPDDNIDVVGKIAERLQANAGNTEVANAYIDLLGSIGTPRTQDILSALLGNGQAHAASLALVPFNDESREQALINISMLPSPTITTVNTVRGLVSDGPDLRAARSTSVFGAAITVLGAVANNLADENADEAEQLGSLLAERLKGAQELDDIELYLDALGNAGLPSTLGVITSYLDYTIPISASVQSAQVVTDAVEIQVAALVALRKIPGEEVESLLLGSLNDEGELDVVRSIVANVLATRDDLSEEAAASLEAFDGRQLAAPGRHDRSWNRRLGSSNLGVEFPGGVTLISPPAYSGIYAYAYQKATALIYGRNFSVVTGELRTYRSGSNQIFGAYLTIGGNLLRRQYETSLPCASARSGTLYSGSVTFVNVTFRIPIFAVITLDINVRATGSFNLSYGLNINVCNPADMTVGAGITPRAWANASASAYLNIVVARGGATLTATILNTSMPASLTATYNALANNFRFCIDIRITTQPLSGGMDIWADVRVPRWGIPPWKWKRVGTARIWSFSSPTYTYNLLVQCY